MPRLAACLCVCAIASVAAAAQTALAAATAPPRALTLSKGWQARDQAGDPGARQPPPPAYRWRPTAVPSVFDPLVRAGLYPGEVRRYRVRFRAPKATPGFSWLV